MSEHNSQGSIVAVRGTVVDARFADRLPGVHSQLRAGEEGDVIVEVNEQAITSNLAFEVALLEGMDAGSVSLTIERGGERINVWLDLRT